LCSPNGGGREIGASAHRWCDLRIDEPRRALGCVGR
jgi:hypothetical protein